MPCETESENTTKIQRTQSSGSDFSNSSDNPGYYAYKSVILRSVIPIFATLILGGFGVS